MRRKVQRWSVLVVIVGLLAGGQGLPQQRPSAGSTTGARQQLVCNFTAVSTVVDQLDQVVPTEGAVDSNTFEDCLQLLPTVIEDPDKTVSVDGSVFLVEHTVDGPESSSVGIVSVVTEDLDGPVVIDGSESPIFSTSNGGSIAAPAGVGAASGVGGDGSNSATEGSGEGSGVGSNPVEGTVLVVDGGVFVPVDGPVFVISSASAGGAVGGAVDGGSTSASEGSGEGSGTGSNPTEGTGEGPELTTGGPIFVVDGGGLLPVDGPVDVDGGNSPIFSSSNSGSSAAVGGAAGGDGSSSAVGGSGEGSGAGSNPAVSTGGGYGTTSEGSGIGSNPSESTSVVPGSTSEGVILVVIGDGFVPVDGPFVVDGGSSASAGGAAGGVAAEGSGEGSGAGSNPSDGTSEGLESSTGEPILVIDGDGFLPVEVPVVENGGIAVGAAGGFGGDGISSATEGSGEGSGAGTNPADGTGEGFESITEGAITVVISVVGGTEMPIFSPSNSGSGAPSEGATGGTSIDGSSTASAGSGEGSGAGSTGEGSGSTSEGSGEGSGSGSGPTEGTGEGSGSTSEGSTGSTGGYGSSTEGSGEGSGNGSNPAEETSEGSGDACYGNYDEPDTQSPLDYTEASARNYINEIMPVLKERNGLLANSIWQIYCDVSEYNFNVSRAIQESNTNFMRAVATRLRRYDFTLFEDKDLQRMTRMLSKYGYSALSCDKYEKLQESLSGMQSNFDSATVCMYQNEEICDVPLSPEVINIMASSRDPEELKHYWTQWHDVVGKPAKHMFKKYVGLASEAAVLNGFPSMAEYWLDAYEHRKFEEEMGIAMDTISQLYLQLHGYVRYKLRQVYGDQYQQEYGPIQINLLGDMWGETWENIAPLAMPYPEYDSLDVTEEMLAQEYTPRKMFELAEDFFLSINMSALPPTFWENSILQDSSDEARSFCDPSVLDLYDKDDVRVIICTNVISQDLSTVHRLVGQAQYILHYQHQPTVFRDQANPGMQETIGQLISQLTSSPRHLTKVHLLSGYRNTRERRINRLFLTALRKVAFLPFAYSVDKYRLEVFRRGVSKQEYNCKFWNLRSQITGVEPPVDRSTHDFDPAAMQYVSMDTDYLQHIFSTIAQFQLQKGLCRISGDYGHPKARHELCDCSIYNSAAAGNALKSVLKLGSSKSWTKMMYALTGYRGLNAGPMLEYFQPLYDWLKKFNERNHVPLGWVDSTRCPFLK